MRSHEEWHRKAAELLRCGHAVQRRTDAILEQASGRTYAEFSDELKRDALNEQMVLG